MGKEEGAPLLLVALALDIADDALTIQRIVHVHAPRSLKHEWGEKGTAMSEKATTRSKNTVMPDGQELCFMMQRRLVPYLREHLLLALLRALG